MKQKTVVLLLVAVGCGLAAAFLVKNLNAGRADDRVMVWTARQDLPVGMEIKQGEIEKFFEPAPVLKGDPELKDRFVADASNSELNGKKLTIAMKAGVYLTKKHLEDISIAKDLASGYRAMTVPVRVDTAGSGFIFPGARVDLITTFSRDSQTVTAVFLTNIRVLAINTDAAKPVDAPTMGTPATATLELKPEQAAKVDLALRVGGQIRMALRPLADSVPPDAKVKAERIVEVTSLTGTSRDGGDGKETVKEKVLVAKRDINKDEPVKNVNELFEEKDVPEGVFDRALYVKDFNDDDLTKAKTFAAGLKAGMAVSRSSLSEGTQVASVAPPTVRAEPKRHKMVIVNGTKKETATFETDGSTPSDGGSSGSSGNGPVPSSPGSEGK